MSLRTLFAVSTLTLLTAFGCGGPASEQDASFAASSAGLTADDAAGVLNFVNYPGTDLGVLHTGVRLDIRAVNGILDKRNGKDGVCPSADDAPFQNITELAAVRYLGPTGLRKLHDYAAAHPLPADEVVKGVTFSAWQAEAVVWGVNHDDRATLDGFLDARAAAGLVSSRPFATVTAMGNVSYVARSALTHLLGQATNWWWAMQSAGSPSLAGVFDGVSFDESSAEVAIDIANNATAAQLTAHGLYASGVTHLVQSRPYASLAQVAAVTNVGTATMTALHRYAQSGDWSNPADGLACVTDFQAAVSPQLPALLFMSESDREIQFVAFPGEGKAAPTTDQLLALTHASAGSTATIRDTADFLAALEPSGTGDGSAAAGAVTTAFGTLTDVTYIAVIDPADSPYGTDLRVYLVGRTACGDLVGITSIAIET